MTTLDAAQEYVSRGWQPIPVPHRSKKPVLNGWPDLRLSAADLARHFDGRPSNLGVLLGVPSGWLVDADLDCAEALYLAPAFLPPTGSCFGRTSKRRSHWLYVVTTAVGTEKFVDSDGDTTFVPVFKLLLASNYRPLASADDDGIWRRLRELPFPTARPRREDRDDSVKATIIDPVQTGAAILAWAVEGCARWLANGLGEPKAVMQATAAYRKSQEPLTDFVADCCVLGPGYGVSATRLREKYEAWCKSEGVKHPLAGRAWGAALRALGCTDSRGAGGARWWDGIEVVVGDARTPDERQPGEDNPPPFGDRP